MMQPDTEPHPVAGGQVQVKARDLSAASDDIARTIDFEVWVDPQVGRVWAEIQPTPQTFPVLLDASTVAIIGSILADHTATPNTAAGIGLAEGQLSVIVQQEWPVISIVLLTILLASTFGLAVATVRGRRRTTQALIFAQHQAASREDERTRVAREIHDGPLQDLALLSRTAGVGEQARIREVSAELRSLATDLRPPALDRLGLASALSDLADRWESAPQPLAVRVQVDEISRFPSEVELALYRVAQEALTNASAHGNARTAWIFLKSNPDAPGGRGAVDLIVRDDGTGLSKGADLRQNTLVADGHFGLAGMTERARALDGVLSLAPGPGGFGAEVRLHIPAEKRRGRFLSRLASGPHRSTPA